MEKGTVRIICGPGSGKTASAVGLGMMGVFAGKRVIIVQFLRGELNEAASCVMKRMEPEMKLFRFERSPGYFEDLSEEQKKEELVNLRNGFNFAKKVLATGECGRLILDEVLGLLDQGIVSMEEFQGLLASRMEETDLVLTGRVCPEELKQYVDIISYVENIKVDNSAE